MFHRIKGFFGMKGTTHSDTSTCQTSWIATLVRMACESDLKKELSRRFLDRSDRELIIAVVEKYPRPNLFAKQLAQIHRLFATL